MKTINLILYGHYTINRKYKIDILQTFVRNCICSSVLYLLTQKEKETEKEKKETEKDIRS